MGLAATVAVVLPTLADPAPAFVSLHLDDDGRYFDLGGTKQHLVPASNGCQLTNASRSGPLVSLSSTPAGSDPGVGSDGLGVKRSKSSGNGSPCTQVDSAELLTIAAGSTLGGRRFTGLRLDLEMAGNAVVELAFTLPTGGSAGGKPTTYRLQTGTSITAAQTGEGDYDATPPSDGVYDASSGPTDSLDACASPNSSGPNSASSDNCRWLVQPGFAFTSFSLKASPGTVSLEGGGDYAATTANVETLLYLTSAADANADTASTAEDTAVSGNVLTNDTNTDGGALTASKLTNPAHGTATVASDGAFTYTPAANYNGSDSFTYRATDGITSDDATVSITVTAVNDPPVASTAGATTNEDTTVNVTVATDVDSTDGSASCTLVDGDGNAYLGRVTNAAGFSVDVDPPDDFSGALTLTCTVTDGAGASAQSQSTIAVGVTAVNDAPVAVDDPAAGSTITADEGGSVGVDVVANDLDVDSSNLTVDEIGATVTPPGATAVLDEATGDVTYTPPAGYTGPGAFTYTVSDGALTSSDAATVTIQVVPVICTNETVTAQDPPIDPEVTGSFTKLTNEEVCKRYTVAADADEDSVTFDPSGSAEVSFRGVLTFPAEAAPGPTSSGEYPLLLNYDADGTDGYDDAIPVPWCVDPQFDSDDRVTSATLPGTHSWCVASAYTTGNADGALETVWQVYGEDDPRFTR